jgi:hypothetical protein
VDDDDDNNNVNKYKITGGKNNGFNNDPRYHPNCHIDHLSPDNGRYRLLLLIITFKATLTGVQFGWYRGKNPSLFIGADFCIL